MIGVFDGVIGALTAVDFGLKLYETLSTFVTKAKNADRTAENLARRVESLHNNLLAVHEVLKRRKELLENGETLIEAEKCVWANVNNTFRSWCWILRQYRREARKLDIGPEGGRKTWIGKTLWQLKYDRIEPILKSFLSEISRHNMELVMAFVCLNGLERMPVQNERRAAIVEIDRALSTVPQLDRDALDVGARRIGNCILVAQATRNVLEGVPTTEPVIESLSCVETVPGEDDGEDTDSADDGVDEEDVCGGSSVRDLGVKFDDTTPREMLEALIKYYMENIPVVPDDRERLGWAEYHQRRLLTYAEEWTRAYNPQAPPPITREKIQRKLSDVLAVQGRRDEAKRILLDHLSASESLSDPMDTLELAEHCHSLAQLHLRDYCEERDQKFLDLAEIWAKRCVKLSLELLENSELFSRSFACLVEVVKRQRHSVEAEVYHRLYLEQYRRRSSVDSTQTLAPTEPLEWNIDLQMCPEGITHLIDAVNRRDQRKIDNFIQRGASIEARDLGDKTPLLHAVLRGDNDMVIMLLQRGAQIDARCNGDTALHHAIRRGSLGMVNLLLDQGAGVGEPDNEGFAPLFLAIRKGQADIVLALCERKPGSRPGLDAQDHKGETALHHAVHYSVQTGHCCILEILLTKGADPNIGCTETLNAPLHQAVTKRHEPSARVLLSNGAEVNCINEKKQTPLLIAVNDTNMYQFELVKLLVDNGATVDIKKEKIKTLPESLRNLLKPQLRRRRSVDSSASVAFSMFSRKKYG